jgi:hypothetical protein
MPRIPKVNKVAQALDVIAGLEKRFTAKKRYAVGGKLRTRRQLVALYQSQIDALTEVDRLRAQLRGALAKERAIAEQVAETTADLKLVVMTLYGHNVSSWGDFGWKLHKKPGPKTAQAKAEGVRKRAERRLRQG